MSIPTLQGLQTALSGLLAEQQALDVTGNNIANVEHRRLFAPDGGLADRTQPIVIPAISPLTGQGAQLGTGVSVATITRIRNVYLDAQYRTQNSALSEASTQSEELTQAQAAFNEPSSSGLASQTLGVLERLERASPTHPTSEAAKQGVVAAGKQLANTFNELSAQLSTISSQAGEQYAALTGPSGEVQNDANQIAQLNGQIKLAEQAGQKPNEMLDRRDLLLDKLSALAQVTVSEQPDGTDTVSFGDAAKPLVEGTTVNWPQALTRSRRRAARRAARPDQRRPARSPRYQNGAGQRRRHARRARSTHCTPRRRSSPARPPRPSRWPSRPPKSRPPRPKPPEATTSRRRSRRCAAAPPNRATRRSSSRSAATCRTAKDEQANLQTTVTAINNQRQSVSGVSLDEEMTNLISFQRGYQASARTLTAMDSMLETLIEHTGTVGL